MVQRPPYLPLLRLELGEREAALALERDGGTAVAVNVLKWVEEAVQASKVHLLSTDHLEHAVNTWKIPFDPSLKEVTVSLSGPSPMIEIRNPLAFCNLPYWLWFSVTSILDQLLTGFVIKHFQTSSSGRHSVRITGLSTIDFRAGFSRKPTLDFKKTVSRPVQGIPTYVLLNTSGISIPARVDRLELLSISGSSLKTIPVKYYPDQKPYGIWNISDFIPPNEAFFLKVTGYDKDDYLFQRVSSVSFSSIVPDAPKVTMPKKTPGYYLQPGRILCSVESLLPFTLSFVKDGVTLGVDQYFKESASVNWDIEKVTLSDEGSYECIAVSSAGTGQAQTFFDVSACVVLQHFRIDGLQMESQFELTGHGHSALDLTHFSSPVFSERNPWNNEAINQVHRPEKFFKH
ncbi:PREDICTED: hemicentin-1-like [Propithecus coquereli]|uniref:hemicentin-1-like n=1 Tax=Propithecus coquereli TaxID=379532 RepID=UPI00063F379E|nr:PREDICTED: hemicentin-1-like [Propithecus coquereli]